MAKTRICPFCGREYKDSFFGASESGSLTFGEGLTYIATRCCDQCKEKYKSVSKEERNRFAVKIDNMKSATKKKFKDADIAKMFLDYLREKETRPAQPEDEVMPLGFYFATADGHFCIREFNTSNVEFSYKSYMKAIDKVFAPDTSQMFTAADITRIEFRKNFEEHTGVMSSVVSYDIRLNDEKEMTYKPCITRYFVTGKGISPSHSAEKEMLRMLEGFQKKIGTDIPVVKVKKFK